MSHFIGTSGFSPKPYSGDRIIMRSVPQPAPAPPAVLCRGVTKRFYHYEHRTTSLRELFTRMMLRRPVHVRRAEFTLRGLDLRVERGESVALMGPNGSGKSTALRLIAGIYPPSQGAVETRGRLAAVIDLGVGFHPELTGLENVRLYSAIMGLSRRETTTRLAAILEFAGIGDFINEPVKYYSSGMQARLAFSVAICSDPEILLLDEVLAVGDREFRARCFDRLREFRTRDGTLVLVSHEPAAVLQLCTRALWLDRGVVVMEGDAAEVTAAYEAAGTEP